MSSRELPNRTQGGHVTTQLLRTKLDAHAQWLANGCPKGKQPDLSNQDFRKVDLSRVTLRKANLRNSIFSGMNLHDMDFREADFTRAELSGTILDGCKLQGARFEGADLTGANLKFAELKSTDFYGANLKDADLTEVIDLNDWQLAGTNLFCAKLPPKVGKFSGLDRVKEISQEAQRVFLGIVVACLFSLVTILSTNDAELLTNSSRASIPFVQANLRIADFFSVFPWVLVCLYAYFHLYLKNFWTALATLPSIFPDGRRLDQRAYPWLVTNLVRHYVPSHSADRPKKFQLDRILSVIASWWMVPVTIVLFWAWYLGMHRCWGSFIQISAFFTATVLGLSFYWRTKRILRGLERPTFGTDSAAGADPGNPTLGLLLESLGFVVVVLVATVSFFLIHNCMYASWCKHTGIVERWLRTDVPNRELSRKTESWYTLKNPADLARSPVKAADLSEQDLRYADAAGAFLLNANLTKALLQHANLSGADLRGADLTNANMLMTNLKRTRLEGAKLSGVTGLTEEQLRQACCDNSTDLGSGNSKGWLIRRCPTEKRIQQILEDHKRFLHCIRKKQKDKDHETDSQNPNKEAAKSKADDDEPHIRCDVADKRQADFCNSFLFAYHFPKGTDLSSAVFTGSALSECSFYYAILTDSNFRNANLKDADLMGAKMENATFCDANLNGAKLVWADATKSDFTDATMLDATLVKGVFNDADFTGACLQETNLCEAELIGARLKNADLRNTNFIAADLRIANLNDAHLWNADLRYADLWLADLQATDLWKADLRYADLRYADLSYAYLGGADLSYANLAEVDSSDVKLARTNLKGAYLLGANLKNTAVTKEQILSACGDETTKLPRHLKGLKMRPCHWECPQFPTL